MSKDAFDIVEFDELVALALAQGVASEDGPSPDVKVHVWPPATSCMPTDLTVQRAVPRRWDKVRRHG